ncbi:MAG: MAPEG family protein [Woeseia sp.]
MELLAIVTTLALLQVFWFAFMVGKERQKHNVPAPMMTGHDDFMRAFRVHMNTVEQLIIFIPGLWLFGYYIDARVAAGLGVLFIIGRFVYRGAYMKDPQARSAGFGISALSMMALVIGGLIGAIIRLISGGAS